ncbi:MAG: LPS export ABC transporter periplasmic protein LptC, partial [Cyanobacteria bacterium J06635_15]
KDVTLEQPGEDGELRWKVHADEVIYSPDQQTAEIVNPDGELFQDGKVIYRVRADRGCKSPRRRELSNAIPRLRQVVPG